MRLLLKTIIFLLASIINVNSGEITDMEWTTLGDIRVFYYDTNIKSTRSVVECYAFKKNSSTPIGGGTGFGTASGTAKILIEVPEKYQKKSGLSMKCKIRN